MKIVKLTDFFTVPKVCSLYFSFLLGFVLIIVEKSIENKALDFILYFFQKKRSLVLWL